MSQPTTPLNAEIAYTIASVSLFCTGHWIGGLICLALAAYTSDKDRKAAERANLPSDELTSLGAELPRIAHPPITHADLPADAWDSPSR